MTPELVFEAELGRVYAGALLAIARADHEVVLDEILRIRSIVARRVAGDIDDTALFGSDVGAAELADAADRQHGDPFRSTGLQPRQIGRQLIEDGLSVALADGSATHEEVALIVVLARALGCTEDDLEELRTRLLDVLPVDW